MSINAIMSSNLAVQTKITQKTQTTQKEEEQPQALSTKTQVSPDDIFKHMSANNLNITQTKTRNINVGNYVTPQSAARISEYINQFENMFNTNTHAARSEFKGITQTLAEKIALSMI